MFSSNFAYTQEQYPSRMWSDVDPGQNNSSSLAVKRFRLQVAGLSPSLDEAYLYRVFSEFGNLAGVQTFGDHDSNAIVEYENPASAVAAMKNLDGVILCEAGMPIRVTWAKNDVNFQKVKRSKKGKVLSNQEASVFVSFAGMRTDVTVNEEVLRRIFGSFGQISEVAIRLSLIDKLTFVRKGYAFIRYEVSSDGVMSAVNAAKVMHNTVRDDVHFHVEISRILASNLQSLTSRNSNSSKFDNRRSDSSINNFPVSRSYGSGPLQHDPFGSNNDFPFHEQSFDHEEYSHFPKDFAPFESPTEYPQSVFRDAKVPMMDHSFYNHPSSSSSHNPPNLSNYPALGHSSSHQPYHRPQNHFAGMNGVRMNDRMNDHHFDGIPPSSSMNSFASSTSSISSSFSSTFSY